ncbi:MAG: SEC-C metal-binding domain-containing protein [Dehalococcoidia bacterium]|nr:SEC-C metal-binding domain-containing protein [Dehalococcoidia bacterium]
MRAAEAVPTLLDILKNTEWMTIIHDRTLQVLHDQIPDLAFDTALEIFDHTANVELKSDMAGILAKGGQGKAGVFERLIEYFRKEKDAQDLIASYLADLGDPRALPDLHEALIKANDRMTLVEIEEAIVELGGALSVAEEQKLQRLAPRPLAGPVSAKPPKPVPVAKPGPVRAIKIGRNEPCPCGSGKKYKKCCRR